MIVPTPSLYSALQESTLLSPFPDCVLLDFKDSKLRATLYPAVPITLLRSIDPSLRPSEQMRAGRLSGAGASVWASGLNLGHLFRAILPARSSSFGFSPISWGWQPRELSVALLSSRPCHAHSRGPEVQTDTAQMITGREPVRWPSTGISLASFQDGYGTAVRPDEHVSGWGARPAQPGGGRRSICHEKSAARRGLVVSNSRGTGSSAARSLI